MMNVGALNFKIIKHIVKRILPLVKTVLDTFSGQIRDNLVDKTVLNYII